ncbi:histidinol dehydrogenase [Flavobacterium sp. Sd200]|uniref:histidinol dehydrogenase n=1 Tax=Flavobacterium sp. Sd200 TaxID=2692211 RepID=UPI00351B469D
MQKIKYPQPETWESLCQRPVLPAPDLMDLVKQIFDDVKLNGDFAIKKYTSLFDGAVIDNFKVSESEINTAIGLVPEELKQAIQLAKGNIEKFHAAQKENPQVIETTVGVECWRESRAIEKIGIYIPGGSAPLFSTVLMLGIPAQIAGCKEIIMCTPPDADGNVNPAILCAANLVGVTAIYKIGGIQSVAAMAIGTVTIPKVYKIFGPGNQYVAAAKQYAQNYNVATDLPAGPSEVLVIADATCNPEFVAADLLSQAEHGADSQVVLLSDNETVINSVCNAIAIQAEKLSRKNIVKECLANSKAILLKDTDGCINFSNSYAPEHLIIASEKAETYINSITNAGSVFLGNYSCESAGDYASGTNHTLPTNGFAKNFSGVSLDSFVKKITFQKISEKGLQNIGPAIELMADAEQLDAHKNAVTIRLKSLANV